MLKDYFTSERFVDAINVIIFKGERVLEPAKIKPGSNLKIEEGKENVIMCEALM